jgi:aspartate/methionine/tyrosine aminotransferase
MDGRSRPIAMVMLSSPANPTGHLLATSTMDMLSEMVADDPSLVIVSDETYRDLVYDGHEPRSPASRAALTQHTVVLRSFSKSHAMAGWRVGYLAAMEPLADRIMPLLTAAHATASTMAQQGARWILERGDASTQQLCHRYQERRNTLLRGLSRTPGLTVEPSQGGLYLFPRVPGSGDACARALWEQAEVAVYPGSRFGEAALRHIRLCFAHDQQVLEEAIARIVPVLSRWGAA